MEIYVFAMYMHIHEGMDLHKTTHDSPHNYIVNDTNVELDNNMPILQN